MPFRLAVNQHGVVAKEPRVGLFIEIYDSSDKQFCAFHIEPFRANPMARLSLYSMQKPIL